MNRKMTALALAGRCGGRSLSGLSPAARNSCCRRIEASASEPNPQKASRTNSRRVRVRRLWVRRLRSGALLDIEKRVEVKEGQGKFPQGLCLQESRSQRVFSGR